MPNGKIYPLTNDICFKYIFSKAIILKDFLNSFFLFIGKKEKVVSVKSNTEVELFGSKYKHKVFYGDILVLTNTESILSIEMYNHFEKEEFNKSVSYLTRIFSSQLERGEEYQRVRKTIGINLMKGNYHYNNFYLVNDYGFINKLNYGGIKDECLEMYLIRLDLVKENVYNYNEKRFIKWLKLINAEGVEEMKKIVEGDEGMEQVLKFMEDFLNDEEIRNVYDKINDVEYYAKKEGRAEGRREGVIETAKNLLNMNMKIEDISKATGLGRQEIEVLLSEHT